MLNVLDHKALIMVTGKGGVGKTLVAANMALEASARGKKVCLVECSAVDQLAPLFGKDPIGHQLSLLADNLYGINLEPELNFRDFLVEHLGLPQLFERIFTKPIVRSFIQMLPGIAELTLLGRLYNYAVLYEKIPFDTVIFDGFASGHFLSLLKTPDAVLQSGMMGPLIDETRKVRDYLGSPKTGVVLVGTLESLVASEVFDFVHRFEEEIPAQLSAIAINRVAAKLDDPVMQLDPTSYQGTTQQVLEYFQQRLRADHAMRSSMVQGLRQACKEQSPQLWFLPDCGAMGEPFTIQQTLGWTHRFEEVPLFG